MKKQLFEKQFGHKPPIGNGLGIGQPPATDFRGIFRQVDLLFGKQPLVGSCAGHCPEIEID
jgi:hypothetical protein